MRVTEMLKGAKVRMVAVLGGLAVAGALVAPAAQAQVRFGVVIGGPRYVAPAPVYEAPYAPYYAPPVEVAPAPVYGYGYASGRDWHDGRGGWAPRYEHRDWHRGYDNGRRDWR